MKYDHKRIEKKWQRIWLREKIFRADDDSGKKKYYQLETFPYPSGAGLHVGHPKGYIAEDIHARYMRMKGKEVLYTMGWDAFGLPTENYAIQVGKSPKEVAAANTENFRSQIQMLGLSYDWDREINTSSPEYYQWTQWLFIQLFKKGLAYRTKAKVNWCPKDQTVLANEQIINGKCDRCGSEIEERDMEQWFLRITDYVERLLTGLQDLDWPSATVKRQEDWIGKSEGALIKFQIPNAKCHIAVFTTRPDTLFGATYVVLAPENELVSHLASQISNRAEVEKYIEAAKHKTERMRQETAKEKSGIELKGVKAINPATKAEIPIWIADYVLGSYGTGAIMAVPAHDERDYEFAKKFGLPVVFVIEPTFGSAQGDDAHKEAAFIILRNPRKNTVVVLDWGPRKERHGGKMLIGGGLEGTETYRAAAEREIVEETGYKNFTFVAESDFLGHGYFYSNTKNKNMHVSGKGLLFDLIDEEKVKTTLDDGEKNKFTVTWQPIEKVAEMLDDGVHRAHYRYLALGEPYCGNGILANSGKFDWMDSEEAKWEITKFVGGTKKIQYRLRDWSVSRQRYWGVPIPMIHCPKCGIVPVPENELPVALPDILDYRPRGMPPLASSKKFMHVACPSCGGDGERDPETLDTFVDSSWYYLRYTDPHNDQEIFSKQKAKHWLPVDLYVIGAEHTVLHLLYSRFMTKFLHDEGWLGFEEPFLRVRHQGLIRGSDGQKMSKSKGNVVNPDSLVEEFGADTLRLYEMFMGPFEDGAPWDPKGILGMERFLKRFWHIVEQSQISNLKSQNKDSIRLEKLLHKTIKKVGEDIESLRFNTAISALMMLLNEMEKDDFLSPAALSIFLKLLAPFAPHMTEEIWQSRIQDGEKTEFHSIHAEPWPEWNPKMIVENTFMLIVQINGKVRDSFEVPIDISESEAKRLTFVREKVKVYLANREPKKIIFVPKRLVNIVI